MTKNEWLLTSKRSDGVVRVSEFMAPETGTLRDASNDLLAVIEMGGRAAKAAR